MATFKQSDLIALCRSLISSPPCLIAKQTDTTAEGMCLDEAIGGAIGRLFNHADLISKCNIFNLSGDADFLRSVAERQPLKPREGFAALEKPNLLEQWFSMLSACLSVCDALSDVRKYRLDHNLPIKDIDKVQRRLLKVFSEHSDLDLLHDVGSKGLRSTIRRLRYQAAALRVGDKDAEMYVFDKLRGCQEDFFIGDEKIDYRLVEQLYLMSSALPEEDVSVVMPRVSMPMPRLFSRLNDRRSDLAGLAPAELEDDDSYKARHGGSH
ncbi:MAG: hypothetical protein P1U40_09155 [Coxiellaceae bacterium]|nr:hypothetical protein [Coxiellaceae bacterium]